MIEGDLSFVMDEIARLPKENANTILLTPENYKLILWAKKRRRRGVVGHFRKRIK